MVHQAFSCSPATPQLRCGFLRGFGFPAKTTGGPLYGPDSVEIHVAVTIIVFALPLLHAGDEGCKDEDGSRQVLNVKDFSARGDGKTDDTTAFVSALKMLAGEGGTLLVPSGRYLVGDLKVGSGIRIKGVGVPRPVLIKTPSASTILDLAGEVVSGTRYRAHGRVSMT